MEDNSFDWNVLSTFIPPFSFNSSQQDNSINSTLMSGNRNSSQVDGISNASHFSSPYEDEMPSTSTGKTMMHNHVGFEEDDRDLASNQNPFEIEEDRGETAGLSREIIFKYIKRMKMGKSSKECTVCFSKFNKEELIRRLPCKHIFHEGCIIPWLAKNIKCPNCRFNLKEYFSENLEENNSN